MYLFSFIVNKDETNQYFNRPKLDFSTQWVIPVIVSLVSWQHDVFQARCEEATRGKAMRSRWIWWFGDPKMKCDIQRRPPPKKNIYIYIICMCILCVYIYILYAWGAWLEFRQKHALYKSTYLYMYIYRFWNHVTAPELGNPFLRWKPSI